MNKDGFYATRIHPIVFMAVVTIVCVAILSALYLSTQERVIENELFFTRRSVINAAGLTNDGSVNAVQELYESSVTETDGKYEIETGNGNEVTVVQRTGPGLWGPITVMIGFSSPDMISGISIVSQSETPGLGARIEEPWFTSQFAGKQGPFTLVDEGTSDAPDEVDGITGATRTSRYFRDIVNAAVKEGKTIYGGE